MIQRYFKVVIERDSQQNEVQNASQYNILWKFKTRQRKGFCIDVSSIWERMLVSCLMVCSYLFPSRAQPAELLKTITFQWVYMLLRIRRTRFWYWLLMSFGIEFDSILAPLRYLISCFFLTICSMILRIVFLFILIPKRFQKASAADLLLVSDPVPQRMFWGVPWLTLAPFGLHFFVWGIFSVPCWEPFSVRFCVYLTADLLMICRWLF